MSDDHSESDDGPIGRRKSWLLGLVPAERATPPAGVPDPITLQEEIDDLREKLAEAERRAEDAESALPHLLALGQRTVDNLLADATRRAEEIKASAHTQAAQELDSQRQQIRRETRELDALRMAVAAEAMGLEAIRAELQRRVSISASEMAAIAAHPMLLGEALELERAGVHPELEGDDANQTALTAPRRELDAGRPDDDSGPPGDDPGVGIIEAAVMETTGFAKAWEQDEDAELTDAFERFFSTDIGAEPSREWILADEPEP